VLVLLTTASRVGAGPISEAVRSGDLKAVRRAVRDFPAEIDATDATEECTPIHVASHEGYREIGAYLTAKGAKVDVFAAAGLGMKDELARLLMGRRVSPQDRSCRGMTPLQVAAKNGQRACAELLLGHGADVNARHELSKWTPLFWALAGRDV